MEDLLVVEGLEAFDDLNKHIPNILFFNILISFLLFGYFLEKISVVGVFHDDTE